MRSECGAPPAQTYSRNGLARSRGRSGHAGYAESGAWRPIPLDSRTKEGLLHLADERCMYLVKNTNRDSVAAANIGILEGHGKGGSCRIGWLVTRAVSIGLRSSPTSSIQSLRNFAYTEAMRRSEAARYARWSAVVALLLACLTADRVLEGAVDAENHGA